MHAQKECTHQLALPWGTRHLISPELAGKDAMILLVQQVCSKNQMLHRSPGLVGHHTLHKYMMFVRYSEPFALMASYACHEA